MKSKLLTMRQAALELNPDAPVHPATISKWISKGVKGTKLASLVIGGRRFIPKSALDEFIKSLNSEGDE